MQIRGGHSQYFRVIKKYIEDHPEKAHEQTRFACLENRSDILLVGEAENFNEAVVKAKQLRPDVVVFDLHLSERGENVQGNSIFGDAKLLLISFGIDDESKALVERIGAERFIDKINLAEELIPEILKLAPEPRPA